MNQQLQEASEKWFDDNIVSKYITSPASREMYVKDFTDCFLAGAAYMQAQSEADTKADQLRELVKKVDERGKEREKQSVQILQAFCDACNKYNIETLVPEYERAMTYLESLI